MDTGSSWINILTCSTAVDPEWKSYQTCPDYYFNSDLSTSFNVTNESHDVTYGKRTIYGKIAHDEMRLNGAPAINMEFVAKFTGIING